MNLNLPPETKVAAFDAIFREFIGERTTNILVNYYDDGMSLREIGELEGKGPQAILNTINDGRAKLERCGLWPANWRDRGRKSG